MNKRQIIGLTLMLISLTAIISMIVYKKFNTAEEPSTQIPQVQEEEKKFELENAVEIPLTPQEIEEGIKGKYNDTKNDVLLIDK